LTSVRFVVGAKDRDNPIDIGEHAKARRRVASCTSPPRSTPASQICVSVNYPQLAVSLAVTVLI
jgi:hypothetical protein